MTAPIKMSLTLLVMALYASAQLQPREPRKRKNEDKEPPTQVLPLPKDPPGAIAAETGKLTFHVSPLSDKGLLTQQTRDALNALLKLNRGAQIVKLRAFVAGTGDMRRIQTIVSELFTEKKQPLPVMSTVQAGALPLEGAQVLIETISSEKRVVNPNGLVFLSGQRDADVPAAIAQLQAAASAAGVAPMDMLRVTCFLTSVDAVQSAREATARAFPAAAAAFIQPLRVSAEPGAVCEAAGREGSGKNAGASRNAAIVTAPQTVFSGLQMAFGNQAADASLAFQRLDKALESAGASHSGIVFASSYFLTRAAEQGIAPARAEFMPQNAAGTTLLIEGLPSLDASLGIEVIATSR